MDDTSLQISNQIKSGRANCWNVSTQ